jgi:hypothetical protein
MSKPTPQEKYESARRRVAETQRYLRNCELALSSAREELTFWRRELTKAAQDVGEHN